MNPSLIADPVRFSHLKTLGLKSPLHLASTYEPEQTPSKEKGTALHALTFGTRRVIEYPKRRAGKEWEAFQADNPDAEILTANDFAKVKGMHDALMAHPYAAKAIREGVHETTLLFDYAGLRCRATPDVRNETRVTELKSTRSAKPSWFERYALHEGYYHGQLTWYAEAVRALDLGDPTEHLIVAVENTPPFVVMVYRLDHTAIEAGEKCWKAWIEKLKRCRENNHWPPYDEKVVEIRAEPEMPDFSFADEDDAEAAAEGEPEAEAIAA